MVTLWQTISEPGPITFGWPTIQESAYQKTRTALIRSNRLCCAYEPTSIQIRISEEFLAKNPKAFRTIEQLLMEAVWRQGKPAEQIKASRKLFCN
jgi:5-methylcytosine-specific restriction endonuclease McrA